MREKITTGASHERYAAHGEERTSSDRSFGVTFGVITALTTAYSLYVGAWSWAVCFGAASALFFLCAWIRPNVLAPANRLWTRLGLLLHRIMNPLIMGGMFFLVFTTMGASMRLFGFDPLGRRRKGAESYWCPRDTVGPSQNSMKQQF